MNKTITLDTPIQRGDQTITTIELRKPSAGELRGCALTELLQIQTITLMKLLPRITIPALTEPEISKLDPADFLQLGSEVVAFLLTRQALADSLPG
ncbi:phage tail assembly protein [Chitinivorax sp. B]|uniref:phage tail assembly protein n=1 Tax=Chitinivorax sp. B TaxID=2502235 RepID=UPI0010F5BC4D|nr:phage tail assembly protein [Chitinivorax sp. B]